MNVLLAVQDYLRKMLDAVEGMKVLLMDEETLNFVSLVITQSQVLQQQVFLFEKLENFQRDEMRHLRCICFIRPTAHNIDSLSSELANPKYGEYFLFFSNVLKSKYVERLASADQNCVVQQVHEFFGDYGAINSDLFTLNMKHEATFSDRSWAVNRIADGLSAMVLSLKRRPIIRFERRSHMADLVASELLNRMGKEKVLFSFQRQMENPPVLLIVDRFSDPVTPLLHQWTYQAMIHELLGINDNLVSLSSKNSKVTLSMDLDDLFANNYTKTWAEIAATIQDSLKEVAALNHHFQANMQSLDDMRDFITKFPDFQKSKSNVIKHLDIVESLSSLVHSHSLLEVSEIEQNLACKNNHSAAQSAVQQVVNDGKVRQEDKLKVVMLYALRYETNGSNTTARFCEQLVQNGLAPDRVRLVQTLLSFASTANRTGDLFSNKSWLSSIRQTLNQSVNGVEIVYTQHKPFLLEQIQDIGKGKLSPEDYPPKDNALCRTTPSEVFVFNVGGITYEEAVTSYNINNTPTGLKTVIGGTQILNSAGFLSLLQHLQH